MATIFKFYFGCNFFLLIFGILTLLYLVLNVKATPSEAEIGPIVTLLPYILILPCYCLYYFISEYFFHRTLAKRFTKTKVVTLSQSPIMLKQIILRSIARIIPFEGASYIVSVVGIHDLLSKTIVIRSGLSKQKP